MIIKTKVQRNYGTDHEYIIEPNGLATLWEQVTGRKTVTDSDVESIKNLMHLFWFFYESDGTPESFEKTSVIMRDVTSYE